MKDIEAAGGQAKFYRADITDAVALKGVAKQIEQDCG